MNSKVLKTLEFDKIIEKLTSFAISPMGKEKTSLLVPMTDLNEILTAQNETNEAVSLCLKKGSIPLGGIKDIRSPLKRAKMGATLSIPEVMNVGEFLYVCDKVKTYSKSENKDDVFELYDKYFNFVTPIPSLQRSIERCIENEYTIADTASTELRNIRREIKIANDKIKSELNSIITSADKKTMLQDSVITIRNERYCVPVKSEYKNIFSGIIHDQSNSGSTVFIEPQGVITINNRIKELQAKEKVEIERILRMLSSEIMENTDILETNINMLTVLDFIFAKANLSLSMHGSAPKFNNDRYINIKKGRHPLLDSKTVVPINIYLGKEFSTLLITGPNTGGKTVALKTLGLFTLMGQAGLQIPAFDNSELGVFDEVFADIGDEQSIEQNLSTFSGHMTNVVNILEKVTDNSLVLFDELGAGTDPVEGAALAMAIIKNLHDSRIRTAVTTHYSELKVYALTTPGVENGCCEFDVDSLKPTYRLLIGIPGKSNAFAISKRLGLSDHIIDIAKEFIDKEDVKLEDIICDLEISKKTVEIEKDRAEMYRREAEELKKSADEQRKKIERQKEKIIKKANEEARQIYQDAKMEADRLIKEIMKEANGKPNKSALDEKRTTLRNKLNEKNELLAKHEDKKQKKKAPETVSVGDDVYIMSFDTYGKVLTVPDSNKEVTVQAGFMKIKLPLTDLYIADKDEIKKNEKQQNPPAKKKGNSIKMSKKETISSQIDCRGMTVDEALTEIDKYLDDAYLSGIGQVMIIHGKGTGALRQAVQNYLRKNPRVKSHRPGAYGEGEMGVTVVEFNK